MEINKQNTKIFRIHSRDWCHTFEILEDLSSRNSLVCQVKEEFNTATDEPLLAEEDPQPQLPSIAMASCRLD